MPEISRPLLIGPEHAIRICGWLELYETAESRKRVAPMDWVRMFTMHDSRGYKRVLRLKQGEKAYLGFLSMLQVAAKMPCRGLLAGPGGPLDALDLEDKTGISEKTFRIAMEELVSEKIGWLQLVKWDAHRDFEGNLAALGLQRSGPADNGRSRQTTADSSRRRQPAPAQPDQEKQESAPRRASDNGRSPADDGRQRQIAADHGREQQTAAGSGTDKKRREEITESPLPSPASGGSLPDDQIDFDEAKLLLHELFGREKRHWSHEEMHLLSEHTPFARSLWPLIWTWFTLAKDHDHPLWQVTKPKQELVTFLREWNGEIDKMQRHAPLFMAASGAVEKKEPPFWRELLRWHYENPELALRGGFYDQPASQQAIYQQRFADFKKENGGGDSE